MLMPISVLIYRLQDIESFLYFPKIKEAVDLNGPRWHRFYPLFPQGFFLAIDLIDR
jgi:hypothetical protein